MTPDAALQALLEGSALEIRRQKDGAYLVSQVQEAPQEARPFQLDRPPAERDEGAGRRRSSAELNGERRLEQITVTGTNIRGMAPDSSPAKIFTRDDILVTGASTAQDFVRTLPANFGGGSNAGQAGLPNDTNAGFNSGMSGSLGSSVNLRGLGSDATLVLLNGHRLAPSSGIGDFVDISMIPASAIERVEVLTDGASSIYGGDAVAGVVNFVLREDFDGLEASLRYGSVTRGSFDETRASVTAGRSWGSGNGMLVYEYFTQSSLSSADRAFSRTAPQPNDLMPSQERQSVLASLRQELTPDLEAYLDVFYSVREAEQFFARTSGALNWSQPSSENLNLAAGGTWTIGDWYLDASGTYSELSSEPNDLGTFPSASKVDSSIWSGDIKGSGSLFSLPGGEVKLAVGAHYRSEDFSNFRTSTNTQLRKAGRDVYAAYAEAFIPLIGEANALPGIRRLELNLSGRVEDYSDFGSTADPKAGILWAPAENLKLRGSYSTSFNPPPLGRVGAADRFVNVSNMATWNAAYGLTPGDPSIANAVVLILGGTGTDLRPETSEALTLGADYTVTRGPHQLALTSTYFDIRFDGRLSSTPIPDGRVFVDAPNIAFLSPGLLPAGTVTFNPTADEISALLATLNGATPVIGAIDPYQATIINRALEVRNLARTRVSGLDLSADYSFQADKGTFVLGADVTYLAGFEQQGAATTPAVDQVNTLYNPVDLKVRGRIGYASGGLQANLFVNYTDAYRIDNAPGAARIDAWTTADLTLSYEIEEAVSAALARGLTLRLSVTNLFDSEPPEVPSAPDYGIFGYDATNASPIGRFVAVEVSKSF